MLQVRVVCPSSRTDRVVETLRHDPEVINVVRLDSAAVQPPGDLVTALVRREGADAVLERLGSLGDWADGAISLSEVEFVYPRSVEVGDELEGAWDEGADVVVWGEIAARAHEEARLSWSYLLSMAVSGVVAGVGVIRDQPVLIVGAMAISPDLTRVNAAAVGFVMGQLTEALRALRTLLLGLSLAVATAALSTWLFRELGLVDAGLVGGGPLTAFVLRADALSVVVALAAGVAAILSYESDHAHAAVGVAISVVTIPAAAALGVALAMGDGSVALDSLWVLLTNVASLVGAASATLAIQRLRRRTPRILS